MSLSDDLATIQDMSMRCNRSVAAPPPHEQPQQRSEQRRLASSTGGGRSRRASGKGLAAAGAMFRQRPQPVNMHITRYHTLPAGSGINASQGPEAEAWAQEPVAAGRHPLQRYSVVNRVRPPAVKSIVRPEVRGEVQTVEDQTVGGQRLQSSGVAT